MRQRRGLAVLAWTGLLLAATWLSGCDRAVEAPGLVIPERPLASMDDIERRGFLIHQRLLAYEAAMAALAEQDIDPYTGQALMVWLAQPVDGGWQVRFAQRDEQGFFVAYDVGLPAQGAATVVTPSQLVYLEGEALAQAQALALVVQGPQPVPLCARQLQPVVIGAEAPDQYFVYGVPIADDPSRILVGGYHRYVVDVAQNEVFEHLPLTVNCFSVERKLGEETQPLVYARTPGSDYPRENDVLISLRHGITLKVAAPQVSAGEVTEMLAWEVRAGDIEPLDTVPDLPAHRNLPVGPKPEAAPTADPHGAPVPPVPAVPDGAASD